MVGEIADLILHDRLAREESLDDRHLSTWRSKLRGDGGCRLRGCPDRNDLEVDQVIPVRGPFPQQTLAVRLHDLEAPLEFEIDPARHVPYLGGCHASPLAETTVHIRRAARPEMLEDHEHHLGTVRQGG